MKTKIICKNCGANYKVSIFLARHKNGFELKHIACTECGQHTLYCNKDMVNVVNR